jgi:hypothetical protein
MDRGGGGYDGRNKRRYDGPGEGEGRRLEDGDGWRGEPYRQGYYEPRFQGQEEWGSPPPWWIEKEKEKERKRKKAEAAKARANGAATNGGGGGGAARSGGGATGAGQGKSKAGSSGAAKAQQQPPPSKGKGKSRSLPVTLAGGKCFQCGRDRHFQAGCTFDPLCVLCSNEGHTSANCPTRGKTLMLQLMGHAISGGGFYNIDVEPIADSPRKDRFAAVIKFKSAPLSESQLTDELKDLADEMWDWQVAKASETEFSVRFPSKETLRMSTRSGRLFLPISQSEVSIREAFLDPKPTAALPSVWVQISGLPRVRLAKDRLMAGLMMIGRPLEVDELSLRKAATEPVHVRFQCRHPEHVKGTVQLFVCGEPFTLSLHAELGNRGVGGGSGGRLPKPPAPRDDSGGEDSEERSFEQEPRHNRKSKDKQVMGSSALPGGGVSTLAGLMGSLSAPPLGKLNEYGTNLPAFKLLHRGDVAPCMAAKGDPAVVAEPEAMQLSGEMVSRVTDPSSSWLLSSPISKDVGTLAPASPVSVVLLGAQVSQGGAVSASILEAVTPPCGQEVEMVPAGQVVGVPDLQREATKAVSLSQGKRSKVITVGCSRKPTVVVPVRKSGRIKGSLVSLPAMEKAQRLAAEKNLETGNDFIILDLHSDEHIASVLLDSCVTFAPRP